MATKFLTLYRSIRRVCLNIQLHIDIVNVRPVLVEKESMSCANKLPSLANRTTLVDRANSGYQSSYKHDYQSKLSSNPAPMRPTSVSRRHNPHPKHVFLLRRLFNEPVCNVWTPGSGKSGHPNNLSELTLAVKAPMSCCQYSYLHTPSHPNFFNVPTRFGANKKKLCPAVGIVPLTAVSKHELQSLNNSEPLKMDITGKRRKLNTAYVLDQQLPQYEAVQDMKERAQGSPDINFSHAITKPSRRKHLQTRPTCLAGCSTVVKRKNAPVGGGRASMDESSAQRQKGEFYTLHQPWPACYSCWAGPL